MRTAICGCLRRCGGGFVILAASLVVTAADEAAYGQTTGDAPSTSRVLPDGLQFANALLRERRYELAAEQYERFLKTNPTGDDLADAHYGLGRSRLFLGDYAASRREFEAFLQLAPGHPNAATAAFRAGESAYLMNDLPAARKALSSYLETYPNHAHRSTALPELGDTCYKLNDLPAAKTYYEQALAAEPQGRLANRTRYFLGRTLAGLGEVDAARDVLSSLAGANDPEWSSKARLQQGQVLMAAGRPAEALEVFAGMESSQPAGVSIEEVRLRKAEALIALDRHDDAEPILQSLITEGSALVAPPAAMALVGSRIDRDQWAEAQAAADAVIARTPDSPWVPRLLYRSAEAMAKQGRADEARDRFLKVATDYPRDSWAPSAMMRAARETLEAHDPARAEAIARKFPEAFPGHALAADVGLIAARAAMAQDRPADAVTILEPLLADLKPDSELLQAAKYSLGLAYKAVGHEEKARGVMEELAKSSAPTAAEARLVLALNQFEARNFADAADGLDAFIAARPSAPDDTPRALAYLALARSELGQAEASQAALDRLAKDWPGSDALVRSRIILAESALEAKRYDEAAAMFATVARSDDPKWTPRALSGLGWSQLQAGKPDEAAESFASLLKTAPTDPLAADAALALARSLEVSGKITEAIAALEAVSRDYAASPEAQSARVTRAKLLARDGKPGEAADALGAILNDPNSTASPDLLVDWGWMLHDAGKPVEADAAFQRVLDSHPDSPRAADARVFLAESLYAAGKPDEAERLLEPVVAETSNADPALVQSSLLRMGKIALARGDIPAATERFDRLLNDFPEGKYATEAQFGRAEVELKAGRAEAAESRFAEISKLTATESATWASLAKVRQIQCLAALERWDDVLKESDALLAQTTDLAGAAKAEVQYARGRALFAIARFDDALAAYEAAISAAPHTEIAARAQFMRGETYYHDKKYQDALREFHKTDLSYEAPEWQAAALLEAGKVYEALGRWTDAVDVYEKILKTFPQDARVNLVKGRLSEAKAKT